MHYYEVYLTRIRSKSCKLE